MTSASPARPSMRRRLLLAGAAGLLALTLVLPLWATLMEAPQYRGEEALRVEVHAGWVEGDVREIELLNQYVGVHLPLDTPELAATPWVLATLLALAVLALVLPERPGRRAALLLALIMAGVLLVGTAGLQVRLYRMGHERSHSVMARVPDFTPPVLGSKKIANFTVHMSLGLGAWAYLGGLILAAWAARQPPGHGGQIGEQA